MTSISYNYYTDIVSQHLNLYLYIYIFIYLYIYRSLDGVAINHSSPRWAPKLLNSKLTNLEFRSHFNLPSAHSRNHCLFLDQPYADIVIKNSVFRPQVRSGDAFEMEWLQTLGIKLFASAGMSVSMSVPMSKIKG